jgi:ribosomal protein S18 acetylase RimI-like enzyme
MAESTQQLTELRRLTPEDAEMETRFLLALPEEDLTFFKEDIDAETVRRWTADERVPRWAVFGEDGEPQAILAIVVGQDYRRRGLGRRLARVGLAEAVRLGLQKIVVEVVADKEGDIAMFTSIGFEAEALLRDHIRDRAGTLRDLVLLSHEVGARSATLDLIGLGGEVGIGDAE